MYNFINLITEIYIEKTLILRQNTFAISFITDFLRTKDKNDDFEVYPKHQ